MIASHFLEETGTKPFHIDYAQETIGQNWLTFSVPETNDYLKENSPFSNHHNFTNSNKLLLSVNVSMRNFTEN